MAEVDPDALQKFYEENCKFNPGDTVSIYLSKSVYTLHEVQTCRVLILGNDKILLIKTKDAKYILHSWSGLCIKPGKGSEFQVS